MQDGREIDASLEAFGRHLRTARLRRDLAQASVADMAGVSLRTLQKLESGDPGVAIRTVASVMASLGFGLPFSVLCSPETDEEGQRLDLARIPKRGRRRLPEDEDNPGRDAPAGEEPHAPSM